MSTRLLTLMLCLPTGLWAQSHVTSRYNHGDWLVGIQGGYSPDNLLSHYTTLQPYGGYFVADKLLLGVGGSGIRQYNTSDVQLATYSAGPLIRYQFTRTRFSPFVVASYQVGQQSLLGMYQPSTTSFYSRAGMGSIHSRLLKAGINVGLTRALQLDAVLCWQDIVPARNLALRSQNLFPQFQFGANYQLGH